jgi:hypothetical protein
MHLTKAVLVSAALAAALSWGCSSSSSDYGTGGSQGPGGGSGGSSGTPAACHAAGTLNVTASSSTAYIIDGVSNPDFTFCRGSAYIFSVNAPGHPFYIKTVQGAGIDNAYNSGVTGNGADVGMVVFAVPADAPATLFYDCSIHPPMTGVIHIID